jgi:hypothetical protein
MVTGCVAGCPLLIVEHWLFTQLPVMARLVRFRVSRFRGTGAGAGGWVGTLLGPEEAGIIFGVWGLVRAGFPVSLGAGRGAGFRPFLENCTVDASISCFLQDVVHRVHSVLPSFTGHTVDALAPGADEGRWSLRYAPGSRQPGCDPGVSEWGNLAPVVGGRRRLNG